MKVFFNCVLIVLFLCLCACSKTSTANLAPIETATVPAEVIEQAEPTSAPTMEEVIASLEGLPLGEFIDASYTQLRMRDVLPVMNYPDCYPGVQPTLPDLSIGYRSDTFALESVVLDLLSGYPGEAIPAEMQLSYDVYKWYLEGRLMGQEFADADWPINGYGLWDQVNALVDALLNMPIDDAQAANAYIDQLQHIDAWVDQLLEGLARREQAGVIAPVFLLESAVNQMDAYLQTGAAGGFDAQASELYTTFAGRLSSTGISQIDQDALLASARQAIEETFLPAFSRLRQALVDQESRAPAEIGLFGQPNGSAYYAWLLRRYTGTTLSAAEIHQIGLDWVAGLQAGMRADATKLGLTPDISMSELNDLINAHESTLEGQALLVEYERLLIEAKTAAADAFNIFPSTDVVITYVPDAPVPAFYQPPPNDGSNPGQMIVTLQNPGSGPLLYNEASLTSHETIPGHHVQIGLSLDLDLPLFRDPLCTDVYYREIEFQGTSEGWAVYAEQLGMEMDLSGGDAWQQLDTQRLLLNQAARMVVDTGIHGLGWTRAQAAAWFEEVTGRPTSVEQMNRYVALPGQAVSYGYGAYTILHLREEARSALGDQFDLAAFHDQVLGYGPVPIGFLKDIIEDWIASQP